MKHLKKINESITFRELSDQIVDILVDIKDDYPNIDGDIFDTSNDSELCIIQLDCENIILDGQLDKNRIPCTIQYYRSKMKFIGVILDCCQRLESALNVDAFIPNLDDFDSWQYSKIRITLYKKS